MIFFDQKIVISNKKFPGLSTTSTLLQVNRRFCSVLSRNAGPVKTKRSSTDQHQISFPGSFHRILVKMKFNSPQKIDKASPNFLLTLHNNHGFHITPAGKSLLQLLQKERKFEENMIFFQDTSQTSQVLQKRSFWDNITVNSSLNTLEVQRRNVGSFAKKVSS